MEKYYDFILSSPLFSGISKEELGNLLNCLSAKTRDFPKGEPVFLEGDPAGFIGMAGAPVLLEIGAGKGGFACKMAERHAKCVYFAMERISDCVVLATEKAMAAKSPDRNNLRFIIDTADNLLKIFAPGTVDHIFLNFSDPWP